MEKTLVIYCQDRLYSERLMDFINQSGNGELCAVAFTEEEALLEYISKNPAEYLLCEEQQADMIGRTGRVLGVYLLSSMRPPDARINAVSRYQSAELLLKKLCPDSSLSTSLPGEAPMERMIGVGTIFDSARTGEYTWKLAEQLSRSYRVLYLNFQVLFRPEGTEETDLSMSELIYRIRQEKTIYKPEDLIRTVNGIDVISGFAFWSDAEELTPSDAEHLLGWLRTLSGYEKLVLGLGGLHTSTATLLTGCDRLCFLRQSGSSEEQSYREFERQLFFAGMGGLAERLKAAETVPESY